MNDIAPIGRSSYAAIGGTSRRGNTSASPATGTQRGNDEVTLSDNARYLSQMQQMPDVRQDLVTAVRQAIDDGTYETDEKVNAVLKPMLEDLA
ncbi:MAG: flagellar biosynthesis anti-sigma factor FlgM [Phycisphaeraceae bacterium]|nr:flagellar biosynthesis anti-sigma factor FlgM [Phycisphaeraceae bacterium]